MATMATISIYWMASHALERHKSWNNCASVHVPNRNATKCKAGLRSAPLWIKKKHIGNHKLCFLPYKALHTPTYMYE